MLVQGARLVLAAPDFHAIPSSAATLEIVLGPQKGGNGQRNGHVPFVTVLNRPCHSTAKQVPILPLKEESSKPETMSDN
jgi:hypothetical protein